MLPIARRLLQALPTLDSSQPLPSPRPGLLILATPPLLRHPQPTLLEVTKHPQPHRPRRDGDIDQRQLPTEEIRAFRVHLGREFLQVAKELLARLLQPFGAVARRLALQEAVESRDDAAGDEVGPDARARARTGRRAAAAACGPGTLLPGTRTARRSCTAVCCGIAASERDRAGSGPAGIWVCGRGLLTCEVKMYWFEDGLGGALRKVREVRKYLRYIGIGYFFSSSTSQTHCTKGQNQPA